MTRGKKFDNIASLGSPFPTTLGDAIVEIKKLRQQLYLTNQKWMKAVEKTELVKRSLTGQMKGR